MPRPLRTAASLLAATAALAAVPAAAADAAAISYVENGEVWVSSLDGTRKVQLSRATDPGAGVWQVTTMSANGRVAAQRREGSSMITPFALWGADGQLINSSLLPNENGWSIYALPLSMDLTDDGVSLVYGYSNSRGSFPMQFETGYYAINAEQTRTLIQPFKVAGRQWPTIAGTRVIATDGETDVGVQEPGPQTPYSTDFRFWFNILGGWEVNRADGSADGTTVGVELKRWSGGTVTDGRIVMVSSPAGLGGALADDCFLPTQGVADDVSVSPDGARVAWTDDGGVKIAGRPLFDGPADCTLTSPPVVISASGRSPSIGGMDVDALLPVTPPPPPPVVPVPPVVPTPPPVARRPSTPNPGGGRAGDGGSGGAVVTVKAPSSARAAALPRGLRITVTVRRAGKVTVSGTVPARLLRRGARGTVVVMRGSATARRAGRLTVTLKPTRAARGKLGRLVGQRLSLRATSGRGSSRATGVRITR